MSGISAVELQSAFETSDGPQDTIYYTNNQKSDKSDWRYTAGNGTFVYLL